MMICNLENLNYLLAQVLRKERAQAFDYARLICETLRLDEGGVVSLDKGSDGRREYPEKNDFGVALLRHLSQAESISAAPLQHGT